MSAPVWDREAWERDQRERRKRDFEACHFGHADPHWDERYERCVRVWRMRQAGKTFTAIGKEMGFSNSRAAQLLNFYDRILRLEQYWWLGIMPFGPLRRLFLEGKWSNGSSRSHAPTGTWAA